MTGLAPLGYEALVQLATTLRRPQHALIALSHGADPFAVGTPAQVAHAEWFAELWREHFPGGGHLRRLHYRLVSQASPVAMVGGEPYFNTVNCWSTLKLAGKWARYLGLIDAADVDDKRSPEPQLYLPYGGGSTGFVKVQGAETWTTFIPELRFPELPRLEFVEPFVPQRYHLEVWVEKSDVEDVVLPLAQEFGFNYCAFAGQPGLKPCRELVNRAIESLRPVRILYLSDFDPQGQSMPVAVARKVEFLIAEGEHDLDIQLIPLALTKEQCVELELPRVPIKPTDRGRDRFEERHGEGATELDALEALHPGRLGEIILEAVARYHDPDLDARIAAAREAFREELETTVETIIPRFSDQLRTLRSELEPIAKRLLEARKGLNAWRERLKPVFESIEEELRAAAPDPDAWPWPEPAQGDEIADPLFDSGRDYLEQIEAYKAFQGKLTERKPRSKRSLGGGHGGGATMTDDDCIPPSPAGDDQ